MSVVALSPTSFPMSSSWLSLRRSDDSGIAPAPCSSAARASTRSSACRSSSFCRAGAVEAGSEDFSSAMRNYICLDPAEYDVELSDKGIADRVGQGEGTNECRLRVGASRPIHRPQVVADIAVENLRRRALEQECSAANRGGALVALASPVRRCLRRDVSVTRDACDSDTAS